MDVTGRCNITRDLTCRPQQSRSGPGPESVPDILVSNIQLTEFKILGIEPFLALCSFN